MSSVVNHLLIVYRGRREHAVSFCRTAVCDELWRGIITHARNACFFQTSTICCRVPDSYATPLRSVPQSTPGRQSLVRTLDLIGYQRQKELTSCFRPVLSNLIMLFFLGFFSIRLSLVRFPAALIRCIFSPVAVLTLSLTKSARNNRIDARGKLNKSLMNYQQGRKLITHSALSSSLVFFPCSWTSRNERLFSHHSIQAGR